MRMMELDRDMTQGSQGLAWVLGPRIGNLKFGVGSYWAPLVTCYSFSLQLPKRSSTIVVNILQYLRVPARKLRH